MKPLLSLAAAALALAVTASAGAAQTGWIQSAASGPSIRHSAAMAYDSARGVVVLFGGLDGDGRTFPPTLQGDTWEWNGAQWTKVAETGPTPRMGHAMVYDSRREVVMLFGGTDGAFQGDTWEWDGASWRQAAATGPAPRGRHGMAYDSARGVAVLFGRIPREDSETWEWDGVRWRLAATTGPSPRSRSPLAYDSARRVTVLFGGRDPSGPGLDDTWEWDGNSWRRRTPVLSPSPRSRHGMAYDAARGVTRIFSGLGGRDTWEWDGTSWVQVATTGPVSRMYPAMAHHDARGASLLFGGWDGSAALRDTWEYASGALCGMPLAFGCETPHCDGAARLSTAACPTAGNAAFALEVSGAVADLPAPAWTLLSLSNLPAAGTSIPCQSPVADRLCFNVVPMGLHFSVAVDARGRGTFPLPIPADPVLRGARAYLQLLQHHPARACPCLAAPALGFTSSQGLEVLIQ